ncbi:Type II secretion system (T2SS), protein F [uncultured archaeon]|nr:Type II secretion system (T2SS), protein F [uncultured archaeon]
MTSSSRFIRQVQTLLYDADVDYDAREFSEKVLLASAIVGLLIGALGAYYYSPLVGAIEIIIALVGMPLVIAAYLVTRANKRTAQIEAMLPNFLSIMASNIRSGVTYDRALLLSSRKEFGPLAKEIDRAAKQTVAGKPLPDALMDMARRTRSETFAKTIRLVVEGMNAGGNLAEMLEITAIDIRQSSSLKKEVTATVTVYHLFIFMAANVGAPLLFALTGFLISVFSGIRANTSVGTGVAAGASLPMFSGGEALPVDVFTDYALLAIGCTTFFSTLASGAITKGKESEGLPDLGWSLLIAYGIFFIVRGLFTVLLGQITA